MNKDEKINKIIKVLQGSEDALSDGYDFYTGAVMDDDDRETIEVLRGIAEKILEVISE